MGKGWAELLAVENTTSVIAVKQGNRAVSRSLMRDWVNLATTPKDQQKDHLYLRKIRLWGESNVRSSPASRLPNPELVMSPMWKFLFILAFRWRIGVDKSGVGKTLTSLKLLNNS